MKKYLKILLFFIVFLGFIILFNNNSYGFSLDTEYVQEGCPDNIVDTVLSSSYYIDNNYSGFFIFDYGKYNNNYRAILFYDDFYINFYPNSRISEYYNNDREVNNTFSIIDIDRDTLNVQVGALNMSGNYSELIPLQNYFFTGVNSSFYINSELIIATSIRAPKFSVSYSTSENTTNPIRIYSNEFPYDDALRYKCYFSIDSTNWETMNYSTMNYLDGTVTFRFYCTIFENGTYYFKLVNQITNEVTYVSAEVSNIIVSPGSIVNEENVPTPYMTCERVLDEFLIKSQEFSLEEILKYDCYYIKNDFTTDYSYWDKMSLGSHNYDDGTTTYHFFFTVPKDSEDCVYYLFIKDNSIDKRGNYTTYNCDFDALNNYLDGVSGSLEPTIKDDNIDTNSISYMRNNTIYQYVKNTFGFLFYPIDLMFDFFERLEAVEYSTPCINVPTVREPFTNTVLINSFSFNLNSITSNETIGNIYNIYIIFVDFIVYGLLFVFLYKQFKKIFNLGGLV